MKKTISRRRIIRWGVAGAVAMRVGSGTAWAALLPTPSETEGPFYPVHEQDDRDADLTRIAGLDGVASGRHIMVTGRVLDRQGEPIAGTTLDIWQADANGRYRHPRDPNPAQLDAYFQGWAIIKSDAQGSFRFRTVMPGAYPASSGWTRPPHIHFKITKPGFRTLITQMYFPGQALNKTDLLLQQKSQAEQAAMIATPAARQAGLILYGYTIILEAGAA